MSAPLCPSQEQALMLLEGGMEELRCRAMELDDSHTLPELVLQPGQGSSAAGLI